MLQLARKSNFTPKPPDIPHDEKVTRMIGELYT